MVPGSSSFHVSVLVDVSTCAWNGGGDWSHAIVTGASLNVAFRPRKSVARTVTG